ncbi:hypothetical protein BKA82DRAFT_4015056 [Pisolithus tinctorius]|nr:hypothetical protein BKA82DRAFT_4015056 [Pisolithus tinctorius]
MKLRAISERIGIKSHTVGVQKLSRHKLRFCTSEITPSLDTSENRPNTQAQGLCLRGEITSNYHHPHDLPSGTSNSNVRGIIHGSKPEEHNRLHFLLGRVQTHPSDTKWRLERDESRRWPQSLMKPAFSLDASSDVLFIVARASEATLAAPDPEPSSLSASSPASASGVTCHTIHLHVLKHCIAAKVASSSTRFSFDSLEIPAPVARQMGLFDFLRKRRRMGILPEDIVVFNIELATSIIGPSGSGKSWFLSTLLQNPNVHTLVKVSREHKSSEVHAVRCRFEGIPNDILLVDTPSFYVDHGPDAEATLKKWMDSNDTKESWAIGILYMHNIASNLYDDNLRLLKHIGAFRRKAFFWEDRSIHVTTAT